MKVFLSGDTRTDWQAGIMALFPDHTFFDPRTLSSKTFKEMAETELSWINQSDIVFAYLNAANPYGFGTSFEIGYAVAQKKTIVYIDEKQVSSSKWIAEHPVQAVSTLEEGIARLSGLLSQGNALIVNSIVERLRGHDFTVLVHRELHDELASGVAEQIYTDHSMYTRLMLASKMLPRVWYDWNLGYLLQKLDPHAIAQNLVDYPQHFYQSEGIAWALGLLGNDDESIIRFLQQVCQECEDFDAWWCAAHSLEQLHHGNAIDILKRTLTQPQWQDVDYCLDQLGTRPATIGLLRKVNQSNIQKIVTKCLDGLRTLSGRRLHNVIWLLERLRVNDHEIVVALTDLHDTRVEYGSSAAHRVVEALGQIAHSSSRDLLERDLLDAKYFRTRAWAAKGLGLIGDFKSLAPLEKALSTETDPHVLSMITDAIYAIKDDERRQDNQLVSRAGWIENGMIIDETNKWYWSPEIYDKFSRAEDPKGVSFTLAVSLMPKNAQIALDLGSGTGRFVEFLQENVPTLRTIHALDASKDMVEFLKRRFKRHSSMVNIIESEMERIPLPDKSVDVVVSSWGFPSKVWDRERCRRELDEVYRVLKPTGRLITIGWDEDFNDEMTEIWYRFVMEQDYYFDTLAEYRRRRRAKINSPRNCNLTVAKKRLKLPVKFPDYREAAYVFGHLFGYSAGQWVLETGQHEFQMNVSVTCDDSQSLNEILTQPAGG